MTGFEHVTGEMMAPACEISYQNLMVAFPTNLSVTSSKESIRDTAWWGGARRNQ
jgi:hypothetical protein